MANKIINLNSSNTSILSAENLLVYADISLNSIPAQISLKDVYIPTSVPGYLSTDNEKNNTNPNGYIMQNKINDNSNEDDNTQNNNDLIGGHIKLNEAVDSKNEYNAKFNELQRQKSHYQLQKNINLIAIKQSIKNIFTWMPGERIINPEFGSNLRKYLYEGITEYNQEAIMSEIRRCFFEWEPRAVLDDVINLTNVGDIEDNTVRIDIIYSVPSLNMRQISYIYEVQKVS